MRRLLWNIGWFLWPVDYTNQFRLMANFRPWKLYARGVCHRSQHASWQAGQPTFTLTESKSCTQVLALQNPRFRLYFLIIIRLRNITVHKPKDQKNIPHNLKQKLEISPQSTAVWGGNSGLPINIKYEALHKPKTRKKIPVILLNTDIRNSMPSFSYSQAIWNSSSFLV